MYIAHITWAFQCAPNSSTCFCITDTVSIISISVKDDAIRIERSSLAIRSLLLLIDLNKEITIISVDESEDVPKAISPIRNTSCSPVEFSSLSPGPDLIDPVPSAKAWLTRPSFHSMIRLGSCEWNRLKDCSGQPERNWKGQNHTLFIQNLTKSELYLNRNIQKRKCVAGRNVKQQQLSYGSPSFFPNFDFFISGKKIPFTALFEWKMRKEGVYETSISYLQELHSKNWKWAVTIGSKTTWKSKISLHA